jgi:hypothetical protein
MLLQNSVVLGCLFFADLILQGSDLVRSRLERATKLLGEILGACLDPFVSKMRNGAQRASKISRLGQIGVLQQNWRDQAVAADAKSLTALERAGRLGKFAG